MKVELKEIKHRLSLGVVSYREATQLMETVECLQAQLSEQATEIERLKDELKNAMCSTTAREFCKFRKDKT